MSAFEDGVAILVCCDAQRGAVYVSRETMNVAANRIFWEDRVVDELARPFVRLWEWVERVGGFPGQMLFLCATAMIVIGGLTWYSNKR